MTLPPSTPTPAKPRRSPMFWIAIGGGGLLAVLCLCVALAGLGRNTNNATPTAVAQSNAVAAAATSAPTEPPAPTEAPAPTDAPTAEAVVSYGLNQDVQVGDIRWKFAEATNVGNTLPKGDFSKGEYYNEATTSGAYIKVRFEIENKGTEQKSLVGIDLRDAQGRTFKASTDGTVMMHAPDAERCIFEQLNPNVVKTCTIYFEVPADVTGVEAIVGDLELFGGDQAAISLGL